MFRHHTGTGLHDTASRLAREVALDSEYDRISDAREGVAHILRGLELLREAGAPTSEIVDFARLHDCIGDLHGTISKELDALHLVPSHTVDLSEVEELMAQEVRS